MDVVGEAPAPGQTTDEPCRGAEFACALAETSSSIITLKAYMSLTIVALALVSGFATIVSAQRESGAIFFTAACRRTQLLRFCFYDAASHKLALCRRVEAGEAWVVRGMLACYGNTPHDALERSRQQQNGLSRMRPLHWYSHVLR